MIKYAPNPISFVAAIKSPRRPGDRRTQFPFGRRYHETANTINPEINSPVTRLDTRIPCIREVDIYRRRGNANPSRGSVRLESWASNERIRERRNKNRQ